MTTETDNVSGAKQGRRATLQEIMICPYVSSNRVITPYTHSQTVVSRKRVGTRTYSSQAIATARGEQSSH